MKKSEAYGRLSDELKKLGLPDDLSEGIAVNLSGRLADAITQTKKGPSMVELLGAVSIPAIQTRINAAYPAYSKTDYGIYSRTTAVIKANPTWTEDQVYAEVEKTVKPASAGGVLVIPQGLTDRKNKTMMIGFAAIGAIALIAFMSKGKTASD